MPPLLQKLSHIPDPRRPKSIKHKMVELMIFGLLAFVFKLSSRREMNRELTGAVINHHLRKIFPELDSIPHADTLARLLECINIKEIENAHIALIKQLINGKKFKKLLINGCLPITIDGCQKLFRNGLLHDSHWLQRTVGCSDNKTDQQYACYKQCTNDPLKKLAAKTLLVVLPLAKAASVKWENLAVFPSECAVKASSSHCINCFVLAVKRISFLANRSMSKLQDIFLVIRSYFFL